MILRIVIKNLHSFKDETEFNLLPGKPTRLKHHKYHLRNGVEILKLSAIYGPNGAGKSNLVNAIELIQEFVTSERLNGTLNNQKFKLSVSSNSQPIELGIEFYIDQKLFFYTFSLDNGKILEEFLSVATSKNREEKMLFHRILKDEKTIINFYKGFSDNKSNKLLKELIEKDLLKQDQPLFYLLNSLSNSAFKEIKSAYNWFAAKLVVLKPSSKPVAMPLKLDRNIRLKKFADNLIFNFNTGITAIKIEKDDIKDFFGKEDQRDVEEAISHLKDNINGMVEMIGSNGDIVNVVNDNGKIVVNSLLYEHLTDLEEPVTFSFEEESDGTQRLIEYIPALYDIINNDYTYIVDEIERSIHPVMIKELISKFSHDQETKGQLIFTTHESNLLDQDILRTDEIWFAEKNRSGATKLYSLSDFKEHNTIDIRKGYLNGRYGAIPFASNLQDLNWNHDTPE